MRFVASPSPSLVSCLDNAWPIHSTEARLALRPLRPGSHALPHPPGLRDCGRSHPDRGPGRVRAFRTPGPGQRHKSAGRRRLPIRSREREDIRFGPEPVHPHAAVRCSRRLVVTARRHHRGRPLVRRFWRRRRSNRPGHAGPAVGAAGRSRGGSARLSPQPSGSLHLRGRAHPGWSAGRGPGPTHRAGAANVIAYTTPPAANPHPRLRPNRYSIAIAVAAVVVLALVASSFLNYVYLDTIPGRASLYGLLAVALIALGTYILVRAFSRDRAMRRKHLIRAGVLIGLGVLLWLLLIDVFVFTQSAGPGIAAICVLVCLPTTGFGLLVVRRMDRNEKEPWRLVLVAAAWGAIVATSLVIWGESFWESIALRTLVPGPGLDAAQAFSAGLLEELGKGSAVLLLFLVMRNEFDDVVDGIVYGAAVGLGFNFMESITYMTNVYAIFSPEGAGGISAGFQWYARQVLGLFLGHATYTAFVGAGIGIARQLPSRRQKVIAIVTGFVVAIAAHFSWDAWLTFFPIETSLFGLVEVHLRTIVMTGPFTAGVVALLALGLRNES